jgi:hypothetical protein
MAHSTLSASVSKLALEQELGLPKALVQLAARLDLRVILLNYTNSSSFSVKDLSHHESS